MKFSLGYFSANTVSFPRLTRQKKGVETPIFIIPMPTNTGRLETSWHLGGLTSPKRSDFDIEKDEWNTRVVFILEKYLPDKKFSGKITYHFNEGILLNVEVINT